MKIGNYFCGNTYKLSGFVYDTEKKTYKEFSIPGKDWTYNSIAKQYNCYRKLVDVDWTNPKPDFKIPADIKYQFQTKWDCMTAKLDEIKRLGFVEDKQMVLDFGIFKL